MADAVSAAADGLVRVEGRDRLPATGIVWDAEGLVLTAHHILERDENINIGYQDGETVSAELLGRDPATDLALLRTPKRGASVPSWAEPESLRVGHLALALGRPGKNVRATMGIVSALGKAWRTPAGGPVDRYLQTDTVMYPGFSGGPLVDAQGRFVGLNSSALVRGVSITVPAPTLKRVAQDLHEHGSVRRAYLGVGVLGKIRGNIEELGCRDAFFYFLHRLFSPCGLRHARYTLVAQPVPAKPRVGGRPRSLHDGTRDRPR